MMKSPARSPCNATTIVDDEDADLEDSADAELETAAGDDRLSTFANRVLQLATRLGQRLVQLGAVLLVWLGDELRTRLPQFGKALRPRLTRLGAAIVAGLLLCSSYPGLNWWWAAVLAFAVLAWVLTRPATTALGGFGYGFLFGLAFYLPLIRWVSILVGATPLLALVLVCSLSPGIFGLLAVVVRQLPGWPIWFAVVWAAQEWLKSTVPFGGFPWGVVAAGQTDGPFLPLVRLGGVPLLSLAIVLVGCSVARDHAGNRVVVAGIRVSRIRRDRLAARGGAAGSLHLPGVLRDRGHLAAGPPFGHRIG